MEQGKSAVITGATQGIGRAIAERFLQAGFDIAVCARNAQDLRDLKEAWATQYPACTVLIHPADLSNPRAAKAFGNAALQAFGTPDVLVNNAGLFEPGTLATEPEGQLERLMAVNLYSAYHLTRTLLPALQERRGGHIFNLCSVASLKAYPNGGSYSISKYALLGFSDNLREELRETGIRVTALCPGATWSRSWSGSGIAPDRIMKAEDVAEALWAAYSLSTQACVETIVLRPQLGDL